MHVVRAARLRAPETSLGFSLNSSRLARFVKGWTLSIRNQAEAGRSDSLRVEGQSCAGRPFPGGGGHENLD